MNEVDLCLLLLLWVLYEMQDQIFQQFNPRNKWRKFVSLNLDTATIVD